MDDYRLCALRVKKTLDTRKIAGALSSEEVDEKLYESGLSILSSALVEKPLASCPRL